MNTNESIFYIESSKMCGPGAYISYDKYNVSVYAPGLGNVTCLEVGRSAYIYSDFDADTCPALASVVGSCCWGCDNICGDGAVSFMFLDAWFAAYAVVNIGIFVVFDCASSCCHRSSTQL